MMKNSSQSQQILYKLKIENVHLLVHLSEFLASKLKNFNFLQIKKLDVTLSLLEFYILVAEMSNVLNRLGKVRTFVVVVCCKTPATEKMIRK